MSVSDAAVIGALRVSLGLDSAQFEAGLKGAREKLGGFKHDIEKIDLGGALKSVFDTSRVKLFEEGAVQLRVFGSALEKLGGIGIAAGVAIGGAALAFEEAKKAFESGDAIYKAAERLHVTTDALQEFRLATRAAGGDMAGADAAIGDFSVTLGKASAGLPKSLRAFQELFGKNFTADDVKRLGDTGEALQTITDKIAKLGSNTQKDAVIQQLGLEGMKPLIEGGSEAMAHFLEEAKASGQVMDSGVLKHAHEMNDQFEKLTGRIGVDLKSAFVELGPALLKIVGAAASLADEIAKIVDALSSIENKTTAGLKSNIVNASQQRDDLVAKFGPETFKASPQRRGVQVTFDSLSKIIEESGAELSVRAKDQPAASGTANLIDTTKHHQKTDQSDTAIDAAVKAELAARLALTGDINEIARIKGLEIDAETRAARDRLAQQVKSGSVKPAAAAKISDLIQATDDEKKQALARETVTKLDQQEIAQRQTTASYTDKIASITAGLASSAAARNTIETRRLASDQADETDRVSRETAERVTAGEIDEAERQRRLALLAQAQSAEQDAQAQQNRRRLSDEAAAKDKDALALQTDILSAQAALTQSGFARAVIEQKILLLQQEEERQHVELVANRGLELGYSAEEVRAAKDRLAALPKIQADQRRLAAQNISLVDAVSEAINAVGNFKSAISNHDWAGIFNSLQQTIELIRSSFKANGLLGGLATAGTVAGSLIGGRTGNAIGAGAGIAGLGIAAGGYLASSALGASAAAAVGQAALLGTSAGLAPLVGTLAAALPVIGIVAGAAVLLSSLLGGKPTNAGAGIDLTTGALSGDKRTSETEQAAKTAADAILQGETALKAAGITLGQTITGLVVGTRDQSQIYTSAGKTLKTAVGDGAAAVEAALKATLEGATYVDDTQKKLVESMLATGKSFDEINTALQGFAAAQTLKQALSDAILQITDPQAYDLSQVQKNIDDQAKQFQAAADAGYITADALAGLTTQLATLKGLQIDQVMAKYASAIDQAAQSAVDNARGVLQTAYDAQASAIQGSINQFQSLADALAAYQDTLTGQGATPAANFEQLKRDFQNTSSLAAQGDPGALGRLQSVSDAYLRAAQAVEPTAEAYAKDLAAVRRSVSDALKADEAQINYQRAQLDALNKEVDGLLTVNTSVLSVRDAVVALQAALAALGSRGAAAGVPASFGQPGTAQFAVSALAALGPTAAAGPFDAGKYLADNKDVAKYAADHGLDPAAFAAQHYAGTGQFEIAAGLRKFAGGGQFKVGGVGGVDSQLVQFMASPNETVTVANPGQDWGGTGSAAMAGAIAQLSQRIAANETHAAKTARRIDDLFLLMRRVTRDGDSLVTVAA
ncbi:hypothetical protein [Phenylobacterium sp.]|jgi:hypothetical protein|uniref:hypothetical protein n=1 Tax=Phenylobacterium sp. TaxID=1871053 RepID=UPI002F40BCDA